MEERQLSLSEVAHRMGKSERTIRRWIKAGKLKAYKPGRDYLIPESAIQELVERSEVFPKLQAPLPDFELEQERRYEQLDDDKLFMFLGNHTHHLKDQAKASRDFFAYLKRHPEDLNCHPEDLNWNWIDRLFGGASWYFRNRVTRDTPFFSEAERILAASEAGEVVPDRLKARAEEFMTAFRDLDVVVEEFAQTKALLQGYELGPGDPAGIFAHSRGPRSVDYADIYREAWEAEQAAQGEVPAKDHDA